MQKWEYKTFRADRDDYKGFFKGVKNEKFEKDIENAIRSGNFDYDISGGAR